MPNTLTSHGNQRRLSIISIMVRRVNDALAAWLQVAADQLGTIADPTWPRAGRGAGLGHPGAKTGARSGTGVALPTKPAVGSGFKFFCRLGGR